jgi:Excalibur calcium-binding domain
MRKLLVLGTGLALAVLLVAAIPHAARAADKDCSDFASQRAAQIFFLKHGGPRYDPDDLDGDDDGVACEDNRCPCYLRDRLPRRPQLEAPSLSFGHSVVTDQEHLQLAPG